MILKIQVNKSGSRMSLVAVDNIALNLFVLVKIHKPEHSNIAHKWKNKV